MSGHEPCLLSKIIQDFFQDRAKTEKLKNSKFSSKKMVVSSKKHCFQVTCRPDRHSELVVTCLLEPSDDIGSKKVLTNQRPVCDKIDCLLFTKITKMPCRFWTLPPENGSNFQTVASIGLKLTEKICWNLLYTFLVSDRKFFKRPPHP